MIFTAAARQRNDLDGAKTTRTEISGGYRFMTQIAFTGTAELLQVQPSQYNLRGAPGRVNRNHIEIENEFPANVTPDAVRAWRSEAVDRILAMLRFANQGAQQHYARLTTVAQSIPQAERQRRAQERGLDDDLGRGI